MSGFRLEELFHFTRDSSDFLYIRTSFARIIPNRYHIIQSENVIVEHIIRWNNVIEGAVIRPLFARKAADGSSREVACGTQHGGNGGLGGTEELGSWLRELQSSPVKLSVPLCLCVKIRQD